MTHLRLHLEAMNGLVSQCGDDALEIAKKLNVLVTWSHNGIECQVYPHGTTEQLEAGYANCVRLGRKHANNVGRFW
jgi:hypothetical protein